jgi:hypothetical protein
MVSNFKLEWPTSLVVIAFLLGLGSLQVGLDVMDYFLSLGDKIGAKDHTPTRLNLVQRDSIAVAVECLKRCHLDALLVTIVIRELGQQ